MSLKKTVALLLPLAVLALSVEIVWRRLLNGQIPPQFSALLVYGLIVVNIGYVSYECSQVFKRQPR